MQALKLNVDYVSEVAFNDSLAYALVVLKDWTVLLEMKPDIQALANLQVNGQLVGVIVTAEPPPGEPKSHCLATRQ